MIRALLAVAVLLLAAGCGTEPQVTFAVGDTTVTARPARYCDIRLTECTDDGAAAVQLAVPAAAPLRVSVPDDIAEAPWHVVFRYRDGAGQEVGARSPVLADRQRDWTLTLPEPADRLVTAEVQQFGPAPKINEQTGEVEFPVRASWVLNTAA